MQTRAPEEQSLRQERVHRPIDARASGEPPPHRGNPVEGQDDEPGQAGDPRSLCEAPARLGGLEADRVVEGADLLAEIQEDDPQHAPRRLAAELQAPDQQLP